MICKAAGVGLQRLIHVRWDVVQAKPDYEYAHSSKSKVSSSNVFGLRRPHFGLLDPT